MDILDLLEIWIFYYFIIEESLKFDKIVKDKIIKKIDNVSIPVVSIEQLIKMKRKGERQQDISDLEALIKLKKL